MAHQRSLRDIFPARRRAGNPSKPTKPTNPSKLTEQAVLPSSSLARRAGNPTSKPTNTGKLPAPPHSPRTPRKRKLECSPTIISPQPVSRGKMLVQLARQKALSATPIRSPSSKPGTPLEATSKKRKVPARRRLVELFEPPDFDRQSELEGDGAAAERNVAEAERDVAEAERDVAEAERDVGLIPRIPISEERAPLVVDKVKKGPKLSEFGYIEFSSPTKKEKASSSTVSPLPATAPSEEAVSCYPPLPTSYQLLFEQFRSADTIVAMLMKRKEICTFTKLKQAVEQVTRRQFEKKRLEQMKTVYPLAFVFRQEKNIPGQLEGERYHLTVECAFSRGADPSSMKPKHLYPTTLVQRRRVFRRNLNSIVKRHHKEFLSCLDPPLEIPDEEVRHWHPKFRLEAVPEVEAAPLPDPPKVRTMSAKDVLLRRGVPISPDIGHASDSTADSPQPSISASSPISSTLDPALKGLSKELIERIKAKEVSKLKATITRTPLRDKQLAMMGKFPHLVRVLHGCFAGEKRAALPWGRVIEKVIESRCLAEGQVEEHLNYLAEVSGGWMSTVVVRSKKYVKLNRTVDVNQVLKKLQDQQNLLEVTQS